MNYVTAINQGLTIRKNTSFIPGFFNDDQGKFMFLSDAAKQTGIDRSTFIKLIQKRKLTGVKVKGRWQIRIKSVCKFIENYRYGKLKTKTGKKWADEEIRMFDSDMTNSQISKKLDRSYNAIKTMRSKQKK